MYRLIIYSATARRCFGAEDIHTAKLAACAIAAHKLVWLCDGCNVLHATDGSDHYVIELED